MNAFRNAVLSIALIYCLAGCESDFDRCVKAESDSATKKMISKLGDDLTMELLLLRIFHYQEEALLDESSRFLQLLHSDEELREALGVSSVKDALRASEFRKDLRKSCLIRVYPPLIKGRVAGDFPAGVPNVPLSGFFCYSSHLVEDAIPVDLSKIRVVGPIALRGLNIPLA